MTHKKEKKSDEMYCSSCSEIVKKEAEICPNCGVRQRDYHSSSSSEKSKVAAGLFGILLGAFGAHKFYLGNAGMGILYLCFFWTFIPGIIGFIEGIVYLTMSDRAFKAKYG